MRMRGRVSKQTQGQGMTLAQSTIGPRGMFFSSFVDAVSSCLHLRGGLREINVILLELCGQ